jgi:hypothetical protein
MVNTDPAITAYILEYDHALKRQVSVAANTRRLDLPLPQSPTQLRALNHWLDALYQETGASRPAFHTYFRSSSATVLSVISW